MIDKKQIKKNTSDTFYYRGLELYNRNRVVEMKIEEDGVMEYVSATVKGSGRNFYDVKFDIEDREFFNYFYCQCPAFSSYRGMCKHCVAVALEYLDVIKRQTISNEFLAKQKESLKKLQMIQKGMPITKVQEAESQTTPMSKERRSAPQTTPQIKNLLNRYAQRKVLTMLEQNVYGKVRLEPFLVLNDTDCNVEFKIGHEKMYILKDVFGLAKRMENRGDFSYGKKLAFKHIPEAFEEDSLPIVRFIEKWARKNKSSYAKPMFYNSYYTYDTPKVRVMALTTDELEQFIISMEDREFAAIISGSRANIWKVTDEKIDYPVRIQSKNEGIEIKMPEFFGVKCTNFYFFFQKGSIYKVDINQWEQVEEFIVCMNKIPSRTAYIDKADIADFCNNLLPAIKESFQCQISNFDEKEYEIPHPEFKIYLDMPQRNFITLRVIAKYGKEEFSAYNRTDRINVRDFTAEKNITDEIEKYTNAYDEKNMQMVLGDDDELLYLLLTEGIEKFQDFAEVYISDALKRIRIVSAPKTTVGVSLSGDLLELKVSTENITMNELIELVSRYDRKKKYYRLKNGNLVHIENENIQEFSDLKETLQLTDKELQKEVVKVPKYRALYLDQQLKASHGIHTTTDEHFVELINNIKTIKESDFKIPKSLSKILRNYQVQGFQWIKSLYQNGFGGILADDMGLGKSLQVISFLLSEMQETKRSDNRRTLIVCPASLVYNWKREIEKFAPTFSVVMVTGNAEDRALTVQNAGQRDILITSYDLLRRDVINYEKVHFFCQVIDEAQYIKNSGTQAAKAVKLINSGFRLALTGTPVENRLSELWSIFDYLMPGFLYQYKRFKEQIEQPIVHDNNLQALERLQRMINPFVLRRLKKDVLRDLPDKVEENMYVQMQGEQQKMYDAHVTRMKLMLEGTSEDEFKSNKIQILAELTKLRQMCCDPAILFENYKGESAKTEMCINLIKNAVENGHKILLFSQFTTMLEKLQRQLKKERISFYTLTGSTKKEKRTELVEAFNHDDTSVFCISLKAGGTGLNLTAADIVIHYDPWWNLAVQNQATDRAHRIGQKNIVNVYKLITKDTIEENIVNLQERKMELADKVLSGDGIGTVGFNKEELLELLK